MIIRILAILAFASTFLATAGAQELGDAARGLAYAKENCANCHAIDPNEDVPAIDGAPAFLSVAETPGMTPTALIVWLQTPHPNMPSIFVPADNLDDVIAYIMSLKSAK